MSVIKGVWHKYSLIGELATKVICDGREILRADLTVEIEGGTVRIADCWTDCMSESYSDEGILRWKYSHGGVTLTVPFKILAFMIPLEYQP